MYSKTILAGISELTARKIESALSDASTSKLDEVLRRVRIARNGHHTIVVALEQQLDNVLTKTQAALLPSELTSAVCALDTRDAHVKPFLAHAEKAIRTLDSAILVLEHLLKEKVAAAGG